MAAARLATLGLFLTIAACERSTTVPATAPQPDLSMSGVPVVVNAPLHAGGTVTRTIDAAGGTLVFSDRDVHGLTFRLDVPAGDVRTPTVFRMHVPAGTTYAVELSAMAGPYDVGAHGFAVPVRLTISYASGNFFNHYPSSLRVAWFPDDGRAPVPQYTTLDLFKKTVTGYLPHFTHYGLVMN